MSTCSTAFNSACNIRTPAVDLQYSITVILQPTELKDTAAAAAQTCFWATITLKNSRCELWQHGAAAFNMCGIAYQRSIMYQSADRTSVWRTMPTQLKTFRAYYPSLTFSRSSPAQLKNDSSWANTMTRHIFNNYVPLFLFFSFVRDKTHLQVGIILMLMVRFFCCLHQPLREGTNVELLHTMFKNICKRSKILYKTQSYFYIREYTLFCKTSTKASSKSIHSQKFLSTLCCSLYFSCCLHIALSLYYSQTSTNVISLKRNMMEGRCQASD